MKEKVLQAMREAGKPVSAGDVTKALGADRKEIDKVFAELKKEGAIVSPVRCKWEPAKWFGPTDNGFRIICKNAKAGWIPAFAVCPT